MDIFARVLSTTAMQEVVAIEICKQFIGIEIGNVNVKINFSLVFALFLKISFYIKEIHPILNRFRDLSNVLLRKQRIILQMKTH